MTDLETLPSEKELVEGLETVPSAESLLALKQRELELLRAKHALMKSRGLDYYRPHEKQDLFHTSLAKRRGVFAGNRFGKSECEAAETVAWFVGERTWYKFSFPVYGMRDGKKVVVRFHEGHENHPFVRQGIPTHATKQLIITTDWKKVDLVWTSPLGDPPGKLWKFIPTDLKIGTKRNHEGIIDQVWNEATGSVMRFLTEQAFQKNNQTAESTDYDRVAVDEPIVQDLWIASARGLVDRDGQGDFALTSLRERWIYDYFFPEDETEQREDRFAVRGTIFDNPHNTPEAIKRFEEEMNEDERAARLEGLPLELSGLVYKSFDRSRHVLKELPRGWTSWTNPPDSCTIYVAIDVHPQTPQAVLFVAVPAFGSPIVYDEIWRKCNADELAEEIKRRINGRTVGSIKADPKAWEEDPVHATSMAQRFQAAGLHVEKSSKAKSFGILNMNSLFSKRLVDPASGKETCAVHFAPTVRRTLWELSRYHYDKENKPVDKDDHMMENMYRLFIVPLAHLSETSSRPVPDFEISSTRAVMNEFNYDRLLEEMESAVGFNN